MGCVSAPPPCPSHPAHHLLFAVRLRIISPLPRQCNCPPPLPSFQIPRARPHDYKLMKKHERTVNRAYGGVLCAGCVKDRVLRAFIVEEQKTVTERVAKKGSA